MSKMVGQSIMLKFTGNWLIDAGVLGFVNLMEEVYGWDLKKLDWQLPAHNDEIQGRFLYAFWYKIINETTKRWLDKGNLKKATDKAGDIEKEIKHKVLDTSKQFKDRQVSELDFMDISKVKDYVMKFNEYYRDVIGKEFQDYKDDLNKKYAQNKKNIIENLDSVGFMAYSEFFTNLSIFNTSKNKPNCEQNILDSFLELISNYSVRDNSDIIDKSMNVFLFSANDFHNEYFGKPPTLRNIENAYQLNSAYILLSVPWSFIKIRKYHFFHTNSLENSHYIYHRLQKYKDNNRIKQNLLDVTWKAVIDLLIERKSDFSLENIHVIEYSGIDPTKQQIQDVEYISISKLNATLLVDDTIRENLNKHIPYAENKKQIEYRWVLEQLLSEKPLTPLIIRHVELFIRKDVHLSLTPSIYALMVDANKQKLSTNELHFDRDFFRGYADIVDDVKKDTNYIQYASDTFSKCITDDKQELYKLLAAIKGNDRNQYLNLLYRILIKSENEQDKKFVSDFVFKNITKNKNTWSCYGLAVVLKAIKQWKNMKK